MGSHELAISPIAPIGNRLYNGKNQLSDLILAHIDHSHLMGNL